MSLTDPEPPKPSRPRSRDRVHVGGGAARADPSDPSILYRGTPDGVERSVDGGATWISVSEGPIGLGVASLAVGSLRSEPWSMPARPLASSRGFFRSVRRRSGRRPALSAQATERPDPAANFTPGCAGV